MKEKIKYWTPHFVMTLVIIILFNFVIGLMPSEFNYNQRQVFIENQNEVVDSIPDNVSKHNYENEFKCSKAKKAKLSQDTTCTYFVREAYKPVNSIYVDCVYFLIPQDCKGRAGYYAGEDLIFETTIGDSILENVLTGVKL